MRCTICGAELTAAQTDLPFKLRETTIVILRSLPVLQCTKCPEYLIEDEVLRQVDRILAAVHAGAEVEVIGYAG